MTSKQKFVAIGFGGWMMSVILAAAQGPAVPVQTPRKAAPAKNGPGDNGDVIWEQQCSRCHTAPEGFSPRISGTVIRHMRVRASLSKHDEQELLHFLNP